MQSLRTRRSQAPPRKSPRQGQSSSNKLAKDGSKPKPRDSRKSRVDDKIKKRMSMRYADISSPTELNMPPMPTIPGALVPGRRAVSNREQDEVVRSREDVGMRPDEERAAADDKKFLDKEEFDPDTYLKAKLANSTEAELKSLQSSLRDAKNDTASELQRNVFKNYAEFVLISKEISTLENEMLELKESLSEYKSMPSLLHIPDPTSTSSSSLSTFRRSSVADLRIMYFNQMQQLHAQIEGSAKFAPTTPGRHIVGEADGVLALNAATYKVMGRVKFVVLDDALLIAKRRRRAAGGDSSRRGDHAVEGKLVADKCWPLHEVMVLDTKDSPSMTNVFKVKNGKETHVFRTETVPEKKSLLVLLRQVGDEWNARRRKEREGEHEKRKTLWTGGDRAPMAPNTDWMAEMAKSHGDSSGSDAKDKAERDSRWTSEWADNLTVAIALRQWEKAVALVEEGKKKLAVMPLLASKLPVLTNELTTAILDTLSHTSNRKTMVVSLISFLTRLNAGPAARTTFLSMRSQVLRSHVRKIKFEGHVGAYVADLAMVYFTGIKHTADWFLASFKENEVASAFIDWARCQVESYAEIFRNQVYSSGVEAKVVEEAMRITYSLSKKLLEEYGLDFRFLLDELLLEHPKETTKLTPIFKATAMFRLSSRSTTSLNTTASTSNNVTVTNVRKGIPGALTIPPHGLDSPNSTTGSMTPLVPASAALSTGSVYAETPSQFQSYQQNTRSRTPATSNTSINSYLTPGSNLVPPMSAPVNSFPLASPVPRRGGNRSPPPSSASSLRPDTASSMSNASTSGMGSARERPPRSVRGSPAPPPRSTNRPGSAVNHRAPIAVAQREGMI